MRHWVKGRNNVLKPVNDPSRPFKISGRFQANQLFLEPFESRQGCRANLQDFFERRGYGNLSLPDELFLKFFPWAESDKSYRNVLSSNEPRQSDQVSRQV